MRHRAAASPGEKNPCEMLTFQGLAGSELEKRIDLPHLAGKERINSQPRGPSYGKITQSQILSPRGISLISLVGGSCVCPHQHILPFPSPNPPHFHHAAHTGKGQSQPHPCATPLASIHGEKPAGKLFQPHAHPCWIPNITPRLTAEEI